MMLSVGQAVRDRARGALAGCASEEDATRLEAEVFFGAANTGEYACRFTALYCALRMGTAHAADLATATEATALAEAASRELPAVAEAMPEAAPVGHSSVTCRCGSRDVSDRTVQARCADEAPDVFYACRSCGRTWRG